MNLRAIAMFHLREYDGTFRQNCPRSFSRRKKGKRPLSLQKPTTMNLRTIAIFHSREYDGTFRQNCPRSFSRRKEGKRPRSLQKQDEETYKNAGQELSPGSEKKRQMIQYFSRRNVLENHRGLVPHALYASWMKGNIGNVLIGGRKTHS
jgi:hypothetical protein